MKMISFTTYNLSESGQRLNKTESKELIFDSPHNIEIRLNNGDVIKALCCKACIKNNVFKFDTPMFNHELHIFVNNYISHQLNNIRISQIVIIGSCIDIYNPDKVLEFEAVYEIDLDYDIEVEYTEFRPDKTQKYCITFKQWES